MPQSLTSQTSSRSGLDSSLTEAGCVGEIDVLFDTTIAATAQVRGTVGTLRIDIPLNHSHFECELIIVHCLPLVIGQPTSP